MRLLVPFALCALSLAACGERPTVVEGSVFIVTRGGANYKLGLVEIGAYADTTLDRVFAARTAEAAAAYPLLEARVDSLSYVRSQRQEASTAAFNRYMTYFLSDAHEARWRRAQDEAGAATVALLAAMVARDSVTEAPHYLSALPTPLATAKSDADGRFSLTVPRGRIVLVALASRTVVDDVERYFWAVRLDSLPSDTVRVMLSNDNLFETRCRSCITGFVPAIPR